MRKFIVLIGGAGIPWYLNGDATQGILFSKEEAERRLNSCFDPNMVKVFEVHSRPAEIVTNKLSIV